MRPPRLAALFATVRSLKGVGPKVEGLLNKLVAPRQPSAHARVIDLLWYLPVALIDRAITPRIVDARIGDLATLEVTVTEHRPGGGRRRGARGRYRVLVEDNSGALELVYFNADPAYLKRLLPEGSKRLISGKLESFWRLATDAAPRPRDGHRRRGHAANARAHLSTDCGPHQYGAAQSDRRGAGSAAVSA